MKSHPRLRSHSSSRRSKSKTHKRIDRRSEETRLLRCEQLETRIMLASDLPFSPVLSLEASDGVISSPGTGAVSQWQDQSGSENHVQAIGSEQPIFGATQTPSGLDAISFDGVDDRLLRTLTDPGGIANLPTNDRDRSVFLVAQFHDADGFGGAAYGRGTINQAFGVGVAGSGGQLVAQGWGNGNDFLATQRGFDPPGATTGWMVISVVHSKDNNDPANNLFLYQNGTEIGAFDHKFNTKLISTVDLNGNTAARMVVGQEIKEQGFIELDIAAWAVYDQALDSTERQAVETYLTDKYLTPSANQAPTATNEEVTIDDGAATTIDILANDTDADGSIDPTSVVIVDQPTQATSFSVDPTTGVVSYTHNGSGAADSFTYNVLDNEGLVSNTATVTISLAPPNQNPTATDDFFFVDSGQAATFAILGNDTDSDGTIDPTSVAIINQPSQAAAFSVDPITGEVSYTHNGTAFNDSFTYTVLDNDGAASNVATVAVILNAPNQAPTAVDDSVSVDDGSTVVIDLVANDTDSDGIVDPRRISIVDFPQHAVGLSLNLLTGEVTYTHDGSGNPDSFTYTVLDNDGAISNVATVNISINPPNQAPVANDDNTTIADAATAIIDILGNDTDADGTIDATSVVIVDQPSQATSFSVDPVTGEVSYSHDGSGISDSFTYTVLDDDSEFSNIATVTINVTTQNQPPVAANDSETIDDGATVLIDILANDLDTDGSLDATSVVIVDQPSQANGFSVDPVTGEVSYTHDGSGLSDSFTYTVLDNQGAISNTATVTIQVGQQPLSLAGFTSELVTATGLNQPISVAFLPDGRMLVLEKGGRILIVDPNSGVRETYMTLTNIDSGGEKGLLDISVSPDFDANTPGDDYIFLYYTPAAPQLARVSRFTHQENGGGLTSTVDLGSELMIWEDTDGYLSCCHYGGGLDHGPDGKIWLTVSDKFTAPNLGEGGTNENLPQDLTTAGGKVIRVNTDGSIPDGTDGWAANPFLDPVDDDPNVAGDQDYLDSIWAYGLRNPFRAEWDLPSGRFFIGEVGGNIQTESFEDIHIATLDNPGANYGWPYYEGTPAVEVLDPNGTFAPTHGFDPTVHDEPIFAYPHDGAGASVTGGEVYRGNQFPAEWDGVYFYGDFTRDFIRYVTFDQNGNPNGDFPFLPTPEITQNANQIVNISVGPDGALYYALIGGQIRRVVHNGGNQAPDIQQVSSNVASGDSPLDVIFTAQVSDLESDPLTFTWNFGDGNFVSGNVVNGVATASYTYPSDGLFQAFVEISDASQTVISEFVPIQVGTANLPPSVTQVSASPLSGDSPLLVTFSAQATDPEGNPLTYEVFFGNGVTSGSKAVPVGGMISEAYTYDDNGSYNAFIVVSDGTNNTQTTALEINVGATQLPPITDDLVLLLESDIKVAVSTGTTVAAWLDGSGNGNNLNAFGDPQLVAAGTPGGQPSIVLDGTGDMFERLAADTINNFPAGSDDRTVFSVVKYVDAEGVDAGVAFGKANFNRALGLVTDASTGNLTVQSGVNAADLTSTEAGEGAGWLTQSVIVSADNVTHYKDGVAIGTQTHTYQTRMDAPNSRLVLGEELGGLGQSQMEFAAVLIYNRALTEIERLQVENYLSSKYFVGNLPPVANDDSGLVATGAAAVIDVLANDSDADGVLNPNTVTIVDQPSSGIVTINTTTGAITYQHDGGASVSDTFTYTVDDEVNTTSGIANVTITVGSGALETGGLVVALESDAGVSNDGGSGVLGWLDSSGQGNDLQTVVGDPTIVSAATPSGADAISFDGDDSLARLGATDALNGLSTGAADRSVFIVARYNTVLASAGVAYGEGSANTNFGLVADATQGNLAVHGGGSGNNFVSAEQGVGSGWLVQSAVLSDNNLDHYRDGILIDSAFHAFNTQATDLVIGEEIDGSGFADLDVAAVLIYDRALTEMERHEVQAYLFSKYL